MHRLIPILATFFVVSPSFAHSGHLGELAGHAHLLGWGLLADAIAATAAIARLKGKTSDNDDDLDDEEGEAETAKISQIS